MRKHRDWLSAYLEYTSHSEAPDAFHLWTGVATIAGALRRRVHISMGYFKWHANFFITFVAPPGVVSKSTTADIGMKLLRQVEGIKMGPGSATWQSLVQILAAAQEDYPLKSGPLSLSGELETMSAITITASELGTFLDPDDRKSIDVLVNLWDCPDGPWEKSTKMDGTETVVNPWFQLVGCTTPAWIAENMSNYFIGGGFASRTLFVFADVKRSLVAYPQLSIPSDHNALAASLVHDLQEISKMAGGFTLSPGALQWGIKWYRDHNTHDNPLRSDERLGGYFARKQTHLHKTAMIKAASQRDELVITEEDMIWAEREVTFLEKSMLRVFGQMNREDIVRVQGAVMSAIHEKKKVRKSDLYAQFLTQFGYETFNAALEGIFGAGLAHLESNGPHVFVVATGKVDAVVERLQEPARGPVLLSPAAD